MRVMPMVSAFVIALVGAVAVGLRPGYGFAPLLLGATIASAMTGMAASALQFLPQRYFLPAAILGGSLTGLVVGALLQAAQVLDTGPVRGMTLGVWPATVVAALVVSRVSGMKLPRLRRGRGEPQRSRMG